MNNFKDFTIFNAIDPDALEPKIKKPMPFPLENFDEEIAKTYQQTVLLLAKLKAAQRNPINNTPARKKRLKSLVYKTNTCCEFLQEISSSCAELWY